MADDGTLVGSTGVKGSHTMKALIWEKDKAAMLLADKYPKVQGIKDWDENEGNRCRKISSDGRYICGAGSYYFEGEGDLYSRYAGWLFDTEQYAMGIREVESSDALPSSGKTEYYSLDGKKLSAPQKGVNVVRYSDGSVRKVVVE